MTHDKDKAKATPARQGESKEAGPPPVPPKEDIANREIQAVMGPFPLRAEERTHFENLQKEALAFAGESQWLRAEEQCPIYKSFIHQGQQALTRTAEALGRALEAYGALDHEYSRLNAECQRLMNVVRSDQDRASGKRGAGGRFTAPEEISQGIEPPPLPGEDPAFYRARNRPSGISDQEAAEYDRREIDRLAEKAGYMQDTLELTEKNAAAVRRAFQRFVAKTAGVPVEDWEHLYR